MKFRFPLISLAALALIPPAHAAPAISSFSPIFGATNDSLPIVIKGSGFYPGTLYVAFTVNGTRYEATNYTATLLDGTEIRAYVRRGTPPGSGPIYVRVNGLEASSGTMFTVIGPGPFITNFFPILGGGNTTVTIQGTHFYNGDLTKRVNNVTFNGVSGTSLFVASENELTVHTPAAVSSGPIVVTSPLGSFHSHSNIITADTNFYVPPAITGFSPPFGRAGTNITLTGSNFLHASIVEFNGLAVPVSGVTNNNSLQVTVPAGASSGKLQIITPGGSDMSDSNFVVRPTIFSFSPTFGRVNTNVVITGENFYGTTNVSFNGVKSASVTGITYSQLTATVPNGASTGPITVISTNGSHTSTQLFYLPPVITGFTPTNSAPGTTVTITGSNLLGTTSVSFNGTGAGFIPPTNNTTLYATVPGGFITGPISVTTPGGTTNSGTLFFYGAPVINSFNPTHGLPGTNVIILGTNFLATKFVQFGGVNAVNPQVIHNGQINALVPAGAVTGPIMVIGAAGTIASATPFTLDSADTAVSVTDSPDPVFVGSNLVYTITVANNGPFAATNVRLTNTLPASVSLRAASATQGSLNTNANPIIGSLGTLASGGSAVVTLTVVPQTPGSVLNSASVGSDYPDGTLPNNAGSASTTVWPLPSLSIVWRTNEVQVLWPGPLSNFTLQFKPALASNPDWSNLNTAPILSGGSNVVVDPSTNPSRFYRLKQ